MNANEPLTPDAQLKQQERSRKRKAILAGGVVLGLGAAVTLAAWSDDVFANGTFNTGGTFLIEGSEDPIGGAQVFEAAQTEPEAITLSFSLSSLTPGDTAYAPFAIKTTDDTTLAGAIEQVTATTAGAMSNALEYSITTGATTCASGGTGNGIAWIADGVNGGDATTTPVALAASGASPVQLCVAVTFPDTPAAKNAVDSATVADPTTVTWQFYAEQD